MSSTINSSFVLLVMYVCLFSVVEVRVAKPVTYSFGDKLPKTTDLQSSSAESKATIVKHNPVIHKPRDALATLKITTPPQTTRNSYIKRRVTPIIEKQYVPKPTIVYNIEPQKLESVKPVAIKKKKLLQMPITFSYNKDLKTAASHDDDHVASETQASHDAQHGQDHSNNNHVSHEVDGGEYQENDNSHEEPKHWSFKKGRGKEHHSGHYLTEGDKGVENYDGKHDYEKAEKGHHDKEGHKGRYEDEAGKKKSHFYDDGLYGEYHKGEKGQKGAKYDEEGEHSKGHNTKGEHNIHKTEEYEKKQEFYDEYHDAGDEEKHGAFHHEDDYKKGGSTKSGHNRSDNHKDHYGKKGHHEKGENYKAKVGHKVADGHDEHYKHKGKHGKKGGHKKARKWGHESGEAAGTGDQSQGISYGFKNADGGHAGSEYYDGGNGHSGDTHTYYVVTHY